MRSYTEDFEVIWSGVDHYLLPNRPSAPDPRWNTIPRMILMVDPEPEQNGAVALDRKLKKRKRLYNKVDSVYWKKPTRKVVPREGLQHRPACATREADSPGTGFPGQFPERLPDTAPDPETATNRGPA